MRLLHRKWRHHGLGMLQSEVTPNLRIHVWHPTLHAMWYYEDPFRAVHDHRFDLFSTVLVGEIVDQPWEVYDLRGHPTMTKVTSMWTVVHAKEQNRNPKTAGTEFICDVDAVKLYSSTYIAGNRYEIKRGKFHTTHIDDLAITLVHRQNFSDKPARVLGNRAQPGIVAFGGHPGHGNKPESQLWEEVLTLAEARSEGIDL